MMHTLTAANRDCLEKAKPGEPMFIILGRDPDGGNIVRLWAQRRFEAGDKEHALSVFAIADAMDAWRAAGNLPESAPDAKCYPPLWTRPSPPVADDEVERVAKAIDDELLTRRVIAQLAGSGVSTLARELARAALAASDREVLVGWQPVETAPKDGTRILLWIEPTKIAMPCEWRDERWMGDDYPLNMAWPTHWMPLPEPPADAALIPLAGGVSSG